MGFVLAFLLLPRGRVWSAGRDAGSLLVGSGSGFLERRVDRPRFGRVANGNLEKGDSQSSSD